MMIRKIDPAQAVRLLDAGQAVAVDVREPDEFSAGHIPGAVLLPLGEIQNKAGQALPKLSENLLVYCRSGRRSAAACRQLAQMGYTSVQDLGGLMTWPYELEN